MDIVCLYSKNIDGKNIYTSFQIVVLAGGSKESEVGWL